MSWQRRRGPRCPGMSGTRSDRCPVGRCSPMSRTHSPTRAQGWKLVALSNSDRDLIAASLRAIGVPFDGAIVASEIGSYKPAHGHWRAFYESTGADRDRHIHVAQSHFHRHRAGQGARHPVGLDKPPRRAPRTATDPRAADSHRPRRRTRRARPRALADASEDERGAARLAGRPPLGTRRGALLSLPAAHRLGR